MTQIYQRIFLNLHECAIIYSIMKKFLILIMPIMLVTLTGCDFLRVIAGRPTTADLEEKRLEIIRAEEEALQRRLDSLKLAREMEAAAATAVLDSLRDAGVMVSGPEKLRGIAGKEPEYDYCIIAGVFRESANARRIFNAASEKGYSPVLINCRSGMLAVGLAPTNSQKAVAEAYEELKKESFCPKDAWILVNE